MGSNANKSSIHTGLKLKQACQHFMFCMSELPVLLSCRYGVLVLLIEIISSTATLGYAILLIKYSKSRRTKGLPIPKKGQQPDLDNLKFHVRVLIPCYKESCELVKLTVLGALKAPLPKVSHHASCQCQHC